MIRDNSLWVACISVYLVRHWLPFVPDDFSTKSVWQSALEDINNVSRAGGRHDFCPLYKIQVSEAQRSSPAMQHTVRSGVT